MSHRPCGKRGPDDPGSHRRVDSAPEPTVAPPSALRWLARGAALLGALAALSLLTGCGQKLVAGKVGVEPAKSGDSTVVIRVSGPEGVRYFGSYGLLEDKLEKTTDTPSPVTLTSSSKAFGRARRERRSSVRHSRAPRPWPGL